MAKFIYKMENILSIKLKLEEQAKSIFSQAKVALDKEEEKLHFLNTRREEYEGILRGEIKDKLDVREIVRCQKAVEILKYDIKIQMISVNAAKQQLELARIRLNESMMDRKIHEKLKETAFEAFMKEENAKEQKEVDERISFTYGKKERIEE
ncbi:MAG: flagellar export protein FliJ [Velocimicrobium sp.]